MTKHIENIQAELMKKVEPRPFNKDGKKDGNFNFIHQEHVAYAFMEAEDEIKRLRQFIRDLVSCKCEWDKLIILLEREYNAHKEIYSKIKPFDCI